MFCALGTKNTTTETVPTASPKPWPTGGSVRVSLLSKDEKYSIIKALLGEALDNWQDAVGDRLMLQWVDSGDADIRISMRDDLPNWSFCGRPPGTSNKQHEPTMNIRLGGWDTDRTIFSHHHIRRTALHLLGHALGL